MSFFKTITTEHAINIPQGLLHWARGQNPEGWHHIARISRFADAADGIDPLLAAYWITQQPDCDRATALLFLARAVDAGFLTQPPAHHDLRATVAFTRWLHLRLDDGAYARGDFTLTAAETALIRRHLGPSSQLALPKSVRLTGPAAAAKRGIGDLLRPMARLSTLRASIRAA